MHITKIAKSEAIAKQLKEIKQIPHFVFWKKYTRPVENIYSRREWKITN